MALNVIMLVLVGAITFMHSIFGFYSGLINLFCTIIAAVVALGFHEALTGFITSSFELHTAYAGACSLVVLFVGTLILLRTAADSLFRGNVHVPQWLDFGGAGVCGFLNAEITCGILVLGVTMLPLGGKVLMFERYARQDDVNDEDHPEMVRFDKQTLWTRCDDLTVGIFNLISSGSMRGKTEFRSVYPDFVQTVADTSNTVQPESSPAVYRGKSGDGYKGISVEAWERIDKPVDVRYRRKAPTARQTRPDFERVDGFKPAAGRQFLLVRVNLDRSSADRDGNNAKHVFRPTMLRLVGAIGKNPKDYVPIILGGADTELQGANRLVDPDNNFALPSPSATIDAYFEVDPDFRPDFIEYRRYARASLSGKELGEDQSALAALHVESSESENAKSRSGGLTFGSITGLSVSAAIFPEEINRDWLAKQADVTMQGDQMVKGRFYGELENIKATAGKPKAEGMKEPEKWRMIQVRYVPKEARTLAGQVFNYVGQLNQYRVVDNTGSQYYMAGYYGIVTRNGKRYIELFYNGDPDNIGEQQDPSYKHFLDFKNIERNLLNDADDAQIGLLFLVPPNVEIRRVENQKGEGGDFRMQARP